MSNAFPRILLLIPAYNEESRIAPVLEDYAVYFREHHPECFSLVVVLNGCTDNTLGVVEAASEKFPEIRCVNIPEPIGKGGALIEGLKLAPKADLVGYVDADGATPPAAFDDLVRQCADTDCVIGSRWLADSVLHQEQTLRRRFASRAFHAIIQGFFWMGIRDTQCGAKVMKREAVEAIHSQLTVPTWRSTSTCSSPSSAPASVCSRCPPSGRIRSAPRSSLAERRSSCCCR